MERYLGISQLATIGSRKLIAKIKSGEMKQVVDPSNREGQLYNEEEELIHYNEFIKSRVFTKLINKPYKEEEIFAHYSSMG
jgi:hypothetical protein